MRASPTTRTAACCRCSARSSPESAPHVFEDALSRRKSEQGVKLDTQLTGRRPARAVRGVQAPLRGELVGTEFPQDPREQLRLAISAVFRSWGAPRAHVYRRANDISDDLGTAANICQMVFGNRGESSGTGVCFSRDPATGEHRLYGEFLQNAQGEDVVAGIRTPEPIERMRELLPEAYAELVATVERLEQPPPRCAGHRVHGRAGPALHAADAHRQAHGAGRAAHRARVRGRGRDHAGRGRPADRSAQLDQLLHPAAGHVASKPIRSRAAWAPRPVRRWAQPSSTPTPQRGAGAAGEAVVLVRWETTPDDIHGLIQAQGVVTSHGGMTSHAAVVARGMGKPCVAGVESAQIDEAARTLTVGEVVVREGDMITIDGAAGTLMLGALPLVAAELGDDFAAVAAWADERRRLRVRANADTPEDARARARARRRGHRAVPHRAHVHGRRAPARGARDDPARPRTRGARRRSRSCCRCSSRTSRRSSPPWRACRSRSACSTRRCTSSCPTRTALAVELALAAPGPERTRLARLAERVRQLSEQNPMLGTRGCRLALLHPGIYAMQVRAIVRGALAAAAAAARRPRSRS